MLYLTKFQIVIFVLFTYNKCKNSNDLISLKQTDTYVKENLKSDTIVRNSYSFFEINKDSFYIVDNRIAVWHDKWDMKLHLYLIEGNKILDSFSSKYFMYCSKLKKIEFKQLADTYLLDNMYKGGSGTGTGSYFIFKIENNKLNLVQELLKYSYDDVPQEKGSVKRNRIDWNINKSFEYLTINAKLNEVDYEASFKLPIDLNIDNSKVEIDYNKLNRNFTSKQKVEILKYFNLELFFPNIHEKIKIK